MLFEIFTKINDYLQETKMSARKTNNNTTNNAAAHKPTSMADEATRGEVLMLGNNLPGGLITRNKSSKPDEVRC